MAVKCGHKDTSVDPVNEEASPSNPGSVVIQEVSRIHPALLEFLFKVYGKADGPDHGTFFSADKIEIYQAGGSKRPIQEIPLNQCDRTV